MKLFQKLLLAPAALGLMAPVAASAADLNIAGVSQYGSDEQVTSITQFSDVKPTDWAYQALSNLIERYGCVAGYPNGTYKGGQAMTRYEAAALLNACLDRVTEVTDELKRLMAEFEKELAVLKGRVDGLEAKVGELEATQFSTTTKLRADTRWVLGGLDYTGNQKGSNNNFVPAGTGASSQLRDALSFNYDVRLNFDTSFTGKDLLRTQLRAGNFADSGFSSQNSLTPLTNLDAAFEESCGTGIDCGDVVAINRLYYKFPVGKQFTVVAGPRVRQDDALAVYPSVYNADKILKIFQYAGAPGAYSQVLGAGAGAWWKQVKADKKDKSGWSFGGVYVAGNADAGNPTTVGCGASTSYTAISNIPCGGIGNGASQQSGTAQLAYTGRNWNITGAYTYNSAGVSIAGTSFSTSLLPNIYSTTVGGGSVNSWSLAGYWQPMQLGWVPSISAGWGYNAYNYSGDVANTANPASLQLSSAASQSWYVGFNWKDAFAKGNALGFAFGQPTFVTKISTSLNNAPNQVFDGNYAMELFYKFQVSDNIAVTPALFYLSAPRGELTDASALGASVLTSPGKGSASFGTFGALVQTTFKF
jgi:hypothetical protein